ncbi:hypothetical protein [Scytonema sp. PRP1]
MQPTIAVRELSAIHQEIRTTDGHRWTQINNYFIQTRSAIYTSDR